MYRLSVIGERLSYFGYRLSGRGSVIGGGNPRPLAWEANAAVMRKACVKKFESYN